MPPLYSTSRARRTRSSQLRKSSSSNHHPLSLLIQSHSPPTLTTNEAEPSPSPTSHNCATPSAISITVPSQLTSHSKTKEQRVASPVMTQFIRNTVDRLDRPSAYFHGRVCTLTHSLTHSSRSSPSLLGTHLETLKTFPLDPRLTLRCFVETEEGQQQGPRW